MNHNDKKNKDFDQFMKANSRKVPNANPWERQKLFSQIRDMESSRPGWKSLPRLKILIPFAVALGVLVLWVGPMKKQPLPIANEVKASEIDEVMGDMFQEGLDLESSEDVEI